MQQSRFVTPTRMFRAIADAIAGVQAAAFKQWCLYPALTADHIAAKAFPLPALPLDATCVLLDLTDGRGSAVYDVDFEVIGQQLSWSGKALESYFEENDVVRIYFISASIAP